MSDFKFVPKITFKNTALITGPALKHLRVPGGVQAYDPIRVDFGRMSVLDENRVPAPAGLTRAGAGAELPDVEKVGAGNTKVWKFTGGDIVLNIEIAVYIIDKYAPVPALFKVIMEHEYLHVLDYQDLAKSPRLRKLIETDETLKPWLAGEPGVTGSFMTVWNKSGATRPSGLGRYATPDRRMSATSRRS